jgi:hypothetical protein
MKSHHVALFIVFICGLALAQSKQIPTASSHPSTAAQSQNSAPDLSTPSIPVIPPGTPDRFNEGLFTAKEQFHDQQIADLIGRVSSLEGRSNFLSGVIWALGILIAVFLTTVKLFWKGIIKVILAEADSRPPITPATHS